MNVAVIGAQWGDEGKGKVVDIYGAEADFIVRSQGGANAGHTLVVNGQKTVLHLIPSGILHPGKVCLIGNGVVFDPTGFFEEVDMLEKQGLFSTGGAAHQRIRVSERAHVVLSYHRLLDKLREDRASQTKGKIGTTVRGIGPAYEDKVARRGIYVGDLLRPTLLKEKIDRALEERNVLMRGLFNHPEIDGNTVYKEAIQLGERLRPFVENVRQVLVEAIRKGRPILFEGAQGALLDVDHGTYPYVTSSNTIVGGALTGTGLGLGAVQQVIGITKAYNTRVGTGPFPTSLEEADPKLANDLRTKGGEFGATTGRPRKIGWLDLVALKYACELNGLTGIALMKSDILTGQKEIKVCTAYEIDGKITKEFPAVIDAFDRLKPVYDTLPGWAEFDAKRIKGRSELPQAFQRYIEEIETFTGVPVVLISTGPGREETLQSVNPFSGKRLVV